MDDPIPQTNATIVYRQKLVGVGVLPSNTTASTTTGTARDTTMSLPSGAAAHENPKIAELLKTKKIINLEKDDKQNYKCTEAQALWDAWFNACVAQVEKFIRSMVNG